MNSMMMRAAFAALFCVVFVSVSHAQTYTTSVYCSYPDTGPSASGPQGGPFSGLIKYCTVNSLPGADVYITGMPDWAIGPPSLHLGDLSGTGGYTIAFDCCNQAAASKYKVGTYTSAITFIDANTGIGPSETATLYVTAGQGPALQVTPGTDLVFSGPLGGPFSPTSYQYQISAASGSINYSINTGEYGLVALSGMPATGTVTTSPQTATFTLQNFDPDAPGTFNDIITFTNTDSGQGTQQRNFLATVIAPPGWPTVTGVTPNFGLVTGGTSVTITGTNFTGATAVLFYGGVPAPSFTVNSNTKIIATSPPGG